MKHKIRMTIIIITLFTSGLYIGYKAAGYTKSVQLNNRIIVFNKLVKQHKYQFRYKMGELYNWDQSQRLAGK